MNDVIELSYSERFTLAFQFARRPQQTKDEQLYGVFADEGEVIDF